jgi:hypothetical protein
MDNGLANRQTGNWQLETRATGNSNWKTGNWKPATWNPLLAFHPQFLYLQNKKIWDAL